MFASWETIVACQDLNFVKPKHALNVNVLLGQTYVPLCNERVSCPHDNELLFHIDTWRSNILAGTGFPSLNLMGILNMFCCFSSFFKDTILIRVRESIYLFPSLVNCSVSMAPGLVKLYVQPLLCSSQTSPTLSDLQQWYYSRGVPRL